MVGLCRLCHSLLTSHCVCVFPYRHFAKYIDEGLDADSLEELYTKVSELTHRGKGGEGGAGALPITLTYTHALEHTPLLMRGCSTLPSCSTHTHTRTADVTPFDPLLDPPQVHEAIRANPLQAKAAPKKPAEPKRWQPAKLTYDERKERLKVRRGAVGQGRGGCLQAVCRHFCAHTHLVLGQCLVTAATGPFAPVGLLWFFSTRREGRGCVVCSLRCPHCVLRGPVVCLPVPPHTHLHRPSWPPSRTVMTSKQLHSPAVVPTTAAAAA